MAMEKGSYMVPSRLKPIVKLIFTRRRQIKFFTRIQNSMDHVMAIATGAGKKNTAFFILIGKHNNLTRHMGERPLNKTRCLQARITEIEIGQFFRNVKLRRPYKP